MQPEAPLFNPDPPPLPRKTVDEDEGAMYSNPTLRANHTKSQGGSLAVLPGSYAHMLKQEHQDSCRRTTPATETA